MNFLSFFQGLEPGGRCNIYPLNTFGILLEAFMKRMIFLTAWLTAVVCFSVELNVRHWDVDGVKREALVYMPDTKKSVPVVFVFHGHGGNMRNTARSFKIHERWPDSAVVYMQGLPTPGKLTDPEGKKNGWNSDPADGSNRDLKFFDTVYTSFASRMDTNRVFSTGHSNGGGFTYCLWAARGDQLAAVAPSAAVGARAVRMLQPKPALHVAGTNDTLVKYEWQERMIEAVKKINHCNTDGKPWHSSGDLIGTIYSSKSDTPLVTLISPGTHTFPKEAPALIVQFFQSLETTEDQPPDATADH
jgi:polyhydroxybutyrate depolymerase